MRDSRGGMVECKLIFFSLNYIMRLFSLHNFDSDCLRTLLGGHSINLF